MKSKTSTTKIRRSFISLLLIIAVMMTLGTIPLALASNDSPISILWEERDIDVTFTVEDRAERFETVGPFSYVETNTAGTFRYSVTPATGITVKDLLEGAGINTSLLEPNRVISFRARDNVEVSFTWEQLSEERYHYTYPIGISGYAQLSAGVRGDPLPAIISFNQGTSAPRNFMGITYPAEQFRGVMNQGIAIIRVDGLAETWASPFVHLEESAIPIANGSVVEPGMKLRIDSSAGQGGTSVKYFYTTNGTVPTPNTGIMFNFNSNSPSISANPSFVVPPNDGTGILTIKAVTHGYGRLTSPVMTYTFYYPDYIPPVENPTAFLTGPDVLNKDAANELAYTVNAASLKDINWFTLEMSYDSGKLDYKGIDLALPADMSAWILNSKHDPVEGKIEYTIVGGRNSIFTSVDAAGIANLRFTLKNSAGVNDVLVANLVSVSLISPVSGEAFEAVITGTPVNTKIVGKDIYDINDDDVFDMRDLSIIIYRYFMVASGEALWTEASRFDIMGRGVIDTANIIALYSLIAG